jgi:dephospho-CoA kinase
MSGSTQIMKRIGLTGGMGSGKSTIAKLFQSAGALILDADEIARSVRKPGSLGHQAILARFKTDDRHELRRILASSPEAKRDLEGILHPLIKTESDTQIKNAIIAAPHAVCLIYEATLLIEAGRADDFDAVIVVTAPLHDRVKRVASRDQISEKDALMIIEAQSTDAYRLAKAHYVIRNEGTLQTLTDDVRKVLDQIIST